MKYIKTYKLFEHLSIHRELEDARSLVLKDWEIKIKDACLYLVDNYDIKSIDYDNRESEYFISFEIPKKDLDRKELFELLNSSIDRLHTDLDANVIVDLNSECIYDQLPTSLVKIDYIEDKDKLDGLIDNGYIKMVKYRDNLSDMQKNVLNSRYKDKIELKITLT